MKRPRVFQWILRIAACFLLAGGMAFAAEPVSLFFMEQDGAYEIEGVFYARVDPSVAWEVLTDYHHLPRFVGSLKKSLIQEDLGPNHFRLEQEFEGGFLFFTKRIRVVLDVHEVWQESIRFADTDGKDFRFYEGSWDLRADSSRGLQVRYRLKAQKNFDAPLAGDFMSGGVRDLLESVRREMERRQAKRAP